MMLLRHKNLALIIALILIGVVFFVFAWMQSANRMPDVATPTPSEPSAPTSAQGEIIPYAAYHELLSTVDGEKTIKNTACNITFTLPERWSVTGILGESKILSPQDERENKEWAETHQELIQKEEGEAPLGPDARSLYISCGNTNSNPSLKTDSFKTLKINGRDAYELDETGTLPNGTAITNYRIVLEGENLMEIHLGQTEYSDLPDVVQQIIQSISFEA